jgi:hypothetical protein
VKDSLATMENHGTMTPHEHGKSCFIAIVRKAPQQLPICELVGFVRYSKLADVFEDDSSRLYGHDRDPPMTQACFTYLLKLAKGGRGATISANC